MENSVKITPPEGYEIDRVKSTFEKIIFKPIDKFPKTWEEFCETHRIEKDEYYITGHSSSIQLTTKRRERSTSHDQNLLPSKELAEATLALCKLLQLRDCYNDGWVPNWTDKTTKFTISCVTGNVIETYHTAEGRPLAFKLVDLRDQFYVNFKDLLEVAKPLL